MVEGCQASGLGHLLQHMHEYNAESPKQGSQRFNYIVKTIHIFLSFINRKLKGLHGEQLMQEQGFESQCPDKYCTLQNAVQLKGAVSQNVQPLFFSWIEPTWAPDKQAKMSFLKNWFSRRYSNLKFKKFNSAQANAAGSQIFAKPFKKLTKMLSYVAIAHVYFWIFLVFFIQGKERPEKTKLFPENSCAG